MATDDGVEVGQGPGDDLGPGDARDRLGLDPGGEVPVTVDLEHGPADPGHLGDPGHRSTSAATDAENACPTALDTT